MHELQDVITVHQAPNLKPHSPNMFPTSGVARLNWSLEEWPRSERCEKEKLMSDGSMKMDEVRSTGHLASLVLNHPMTWDFCIDSRNTRMSKDFTCRSGLRCLFCNCNLWSRAKLRSFSSAFWDGRTYMHLFTARHIAIPST